MTDDARIVDQGYRPFEGERGGLAASMRALIIHSIQRVLGIKRTIWQKVMPIVSILIAYVPAIVFVGIAALTDNLIENEGTNFQEVLLPSYPEYYGFVTAAIILFTAFVGPELLCTDRRTGMLGLYLASPVDRDRYLLAKTAAVAIILSIVTIGPLLLLLVSFTFEGIGPDGIGSFAKTLVQILVGGFLISALYTALSMVVSSLTDRRTVASAAIIMVLLISPIIAEALTQDANLSSNFQVLNLFLLPFELAGRVFGERGDDSIREVSTGVLAAAYACWTLLGAFVVRFTYRRMLVTR